MKKLTTITLFLIFFGVLLPKYFNDTRAASLSFGSTTATTTNGGTFQITVTVNPGSDSLSSVDAYITYDSTLLRATTVTAGSLFPTVSNDIATSGRVYIAGMVNDPASSVTTTGTLATVTFQGLKDGSGTLAFDCNLSKVIKNDINATNVMTCSQNGTCAVTVGAGGTNPTAPPAEGGELPQSGIFDNIVKFAVPGIILLFLGGVLRFL